MKLKKGQWALTNDKRLGKITKVGYAQAMNQYCYSITLKCSPLQEIVTCACSLTPIPLKATKAQRDALKKILK